MSGAAERLILRGGFASALGFLARFGARFAILFIAARFYGASLFGAFSLAVAVVELAAMVGGLGTRKLLFQHLDRNAQRGARPPVHIVLDATLMVTAASLALAALLLLTLAAVPAETIAPNTALALAVLAPAIAGQALLDLFTAATRWRHVLRDEILSRSVVEPWAGMAAALLAWWAGLEEIGLALGYWAGTLAALAFSAAGVRRAYGGLALGAYRPALSNLRALLHATGPNTLSDVLNALFARLDLYLVGLLMGEAPAGIYGMARQLRTPVRQIRQSLDSLLTPIAARTVDLAGPARTGLALASATRLILAIQLPVLLALFALGAPLLDAFGRGFAAGYWAMLIVTSAEVVQGAWGLSALLFVYRRPRLGLALIALWTAIGAGAGILLIPRFGLEGAAASVLFAYAGMALHRRFALARHLGVKVPARHGLGPVLAALAGLAAMLALRSITPPWPLLTLAGLAVYALALLAWLRLTGERLSMKGFVIAAEPQDPPSPAPISPAR